MEHDGRDDTGGLDALGPTTTVRRRRFRHRTVRADLRGAVTDAFRYLGRHGVVVVLLALVTFAPLAVFDLAQARTVWEAGDPFPALDEEARERMRDIGIDVPPRSFWDRLAAKNRLSPLIGQACALLLQSVLALGVFQFLSRQRPEVGSSLAAGVRAMPAVVGSSVVLAVLLFLAVMLAGVPVAMVLFLILGPSLAAVLGVAVLAGCVLSAVYSAFICTIPVAVVERRGPLKALARSSWLTAGSRLGILGVLVVAVFAQACAATVVQVFLRDVSTWSQIQAGVLVITALNALVAAVVAVLAAVLYGYLRKAKEGVSTEELVAIFRDADL